MQLRLDAADRLVELVEDRRGPVPADEAARSVLKLGTAVPVGLARSLLEEAVQDDARLRWAGDLVALAAPGGEGLLLEHATFVVFDLETTGLRPGTARPCEIGAVRVEQLELTERFQTLANPGGRLQPAVAALTGLRDAELRRAPPVTAAVRRFLAFAGDAVLVAHNARFDMAFLDAETMRLTGRRVAATVLDTVGLARCLLGRRPANLAALAYRFATDAKPCHRALPDAEATAEILVQLLGLAQERGARTVGDVVELAATRPRRVHRKRSLAFGAPQRPGVYLFRDVHDQVLYVGRARDLRARLRSYFRSERQRPAVESALAAVDRIDWEVMGSELDAGLEELRLIRELRPPANARSARPDRYLYLHRKGDSVVCSEQPTELGPIKSRRRAQPPQGAARGGMGDARRRAATRPGKARSAGARSALRGCGAPARPARGARGGASPTSRTSSGCGRLEICIVAPALEEGRAAASSWPRAGRVRPAPPRSARHWSGRPAWRQSPARSGRLRPRRPTSCCWSARSCGDRRPSCRSFARTWFVL